MFKKQLFYIFLLILAVASISKTHAITDSTTPISPKDAIKQERQAIQENRKQLKDSIKQAKQTVREEIAQKRQEAQEKFKAQREEFKTKLEALKDARKKAIVEKFDTKLSEVNKNQTDRMAQNLEKMTNKITELSTKISSAKQAGLNTTAAESAITNAQTKIAAAKTAVANQAGKEYTATITTEANLKVNLGSTMLTLRADLISTHQAIVAVKEAVVTAIKEVNTLRINKKTGDNKLIPVVTSAL